MTKLWIRLVGIDCIRMFGLWDGIKFLLKMDIVDPIKIWYWETFKIKKWCTWEGWFCDDTNCQYTHLDKPPKPEDYPIKEKDMCDYCGEELAITHIRNPNFDEEPWFWKVCKNCDEIIPLQEQQSLDMHMMTNFPSKNGKDFTEKNFRESTKKIKDFEKRTGKKAYTIEIVTTESGNFEAREIGEDKK